MKATVIPPLPNPFAPGPGIIPAHVVGRKKELRELGRDLQDIAGDWREDGRLPYTPPTPILLTGPRKVGKTLLLDWVAEQAEDRGMLPVRFSQMGDSADMIGEMIQVITRKDDGIFRNLLERKSLKMGPLEVNWELHPMTRFDFEQALKAQLEKQPVVLLMDEVQHYHAEHLRMIIHTVQHLLTSKYPLMTILAGTPDMTSFLMKIAPFIARGNMMPIDLLADEDVREGLEKPFAAHGIEVEESALQKMQSLTEGYPCFIPIVGHAVWETLHNKKGEEKRKIVDLPLVEKARRDIKEQRNEFYRTLCDEMGVGGMHIYAQQIADTIKRNSFRPTSWGVLEAKLEQMNDELQPERRAFEVVRTLLNSGFLWPEKRISLSLGMPSFLSFIKEMNEAETQQHDTIEKTEEKQKRSRSRGDGSSKD